MFKISILVIDLDRAHLKGVLAQNSLYSHFIAMVITKTLTNELNTMLQIDFQRAV